MKVSADLRPEGKVGPLTRTLESWQDYLGRDAETWEKQALLRARVVVASEAVAARITEEMDRHRYPEGGLDASSRRAITRMKARVESERLPRNADPARHLKLGRGGMTDVEWCVQLLALEHGHEVEGLRTTSTLAQLEAAVDAELLGAREASELRGAWALAWQLRRALFLWKGREGEVLPTDRHDLRALALLIEGEDATAAELEDSYLKATRRSRMIAEQIIFGEEG
jgi:glutamate-ammonia-ligase adenylyltransferase